MAAEVRVRRDLDRGMAMKTIWNWRLRSGTRFLALGAAAFFAVGAAGCHRSTVNAQTGPDPATANLAQPGAENEAQQQAAQYGNQPAPYDNSQQAGQQPPAPIERAYPNAQSGPPPAYSDNQQPYAGDQGYDQGDDQQYAPVYDDSLTDEQASEPPPPLPDYDQPPDPDPDDIWTPGYWAWGPYGYYWVPGAWVEAPYVGALWTPGYWGYVGNVYRFHHGYWGRHIGFYGGIDYGFGYIGVGYDGGYWNGSHFYYNTAVTRVDTRVVRNVYVHNVVVDNRVVNGPPVNRTSFNGGRGGLQVRPRPAEVAAMHEQRYAPMQSQTQVQQQASQNRQQFYGTNHGQPAQTVAARPVVSDHRMPAELPRAAAMAARPGAQAQPNRQPEAAQPGQFGQRPDFRSAPQQGQNAPRGGSAPELQRPGQVQPNSPAFRHGAQETRPVGPQNASSSQPQPEGGPQYQGRGQNPPQPQAQPAFHPQMQPQTQHTAPQPQSVPQQRPEFQQRQMTPQRPQQNATPRTQTVPQPGPQFHPQPQAQPAFHPQMQPQPRPQEQMRQAPPPPPQHQPQPQLQRQAPQQPQARPEPQHQAPPQQHHDDGHDQH